MMSFSLTSGPPGVDHASGFQKVKEIDVEDLKKQAAAQNQG